MPEDALEALRHTIRKMRVVEYQNPAISYWAADMEAILAAWEKERAESALKARALEASPQAMGLYRADLATLRLEVLKVAEEMEGRTPEGNIIIDDRPLGLWVKELAARLRKAAE